MSECGNVTATLDSEFKDKQPDAFAANPSLYEIGGVSGSTITPLLNAGTIRPLDDLVAKYGHCLLYTSPSPRDRTRSRMPSSA